MASPRPPRVLSRGDTIGFVLFLIGGVAIAVAAVVQSVVAIAQVPTNRDITLLAPFVATEAQAPLGPDGAPVAVQLDSASVTVASLQPAALGALVISHVLVRGRDGDGGDLLLILCFGILRGRIFSRAHTALVTAAGLVAIAGMYFVPFFHNMAVNGALALLSDGRTIAPSSERSISCPSSASPSSSRSRAPPSRSVTACSATPRVSRMTPAVTDDGAHRHPLSSRRASGSARHDADPPERTRRSLGGQPVGAEERSCRAIRYSTLSAICRVLECEVGELLVAER